MKRQHFIDSCGFLVFYLYVWSLSLLVVFYFLCFVFRVLFIKYIQAIFKAKIHSFQYVLSMLCFIWFTICAEDQRCRHLGGYINAFDALVLYGLSWALVLFSPSKKPMDHKTKNPTKDAFLFCFFFFSRLLLNPVLCAVW